MHSFFVRKENISGDSIVISDLSEVHHLRDVLRVKIKEKVIIFDESGNKYLSCVEAMTGRVLLSIKERHTSNTAGAGLEVTIACAIPKNSKMDDIIDKLIQLGVFKIIPLLTERVVVRLDKNKQSLRLKRWEKIALSAAKQSHSPHLAAITPIKHFKEVLDDSAPYGLKLIPTLAHPGRSSLKQALRKNTAKNILVLIGPEGDFTDEEIRLAQGKGFIPVTLGDLVLRVETAAVAVASFIRFYSYEDR
jgi:16S rRNA (uracil1498-N3)-methyltransferase